MPFDAHKPKQKPFVIIRTASAQELTNYEKYKLKTIEENAQENKIENIKLNINEQSSFVDITNKEAVINLGELALCNEVSPTDISTDEIFIIECALNSDSKEIK